MKTYTTTVKAVCPITKELKTYAGIHVKAENKEQARLWLDTEGYGYCEVSDELVEMIPFVDNRN